MKTIPIVNLFILLLPVAVVTWFYWKWVGRQTELLIAVVRMALQLILVGYALEFIFDQNTSIWGLGVVGFMVVVSSWIALRVVEKKTIAGYLEILAAVLTGGGVNLVLVIFGVIQLDPWYELKFLIPIAGMVFSNGMNVLSLGIERFEKELDASKDFVQSRNSAFRASMIPQVNTLLAVGLVALPGMMTGQILSGVSPLMAVRYQIMVMAMLLGTAGITLVVYFLIRQRRITDNSASG
jgi:putative ABC transport system permease protein